ncbi:CrcB family protein [Tsukamurella soli]|uniref:CrcB family protein n=1 Tax=Tsukamurella soli TaxID=644556 RepID=UPI0031E64374
MQTEAEPGRDTPWPTAALVAAGGALGAAARYALGIAFPPNGFPYVVLVEQVLGCLALGVLLSATRAGGASARRWRSLGGLGLLGGFTALGAYAVAGVDAQPPAAGLLFLVVMPVAGLAAVACGYGLTSRLRATRG